MSRMSLAMPRDREWTVDDLALLPDDDGLQYELVDGVLLVTGAPTVRHQRAVARLYAQLLDACPEHLEVFFAPTDFQPSRQRSLHPDLLVIAREHAQGDVITEPLLLAVEVISPSTRTRDLVLKPSLYAQARVASYWVVDLGDVTITAYELVDGDYVETGRGEGTVPLITAAPYAVRLVPTDLL